MNITEHISAFLKTGKTLEIPNIGAFTASRVEAHYDEQTSTFHPTGMEVKYNPTCTGGNSIVEFIAEKECVGMATATQLWKNYASAIADKISADGAVTLKGLGTITADGDRYSFAPDAATDDGDQHIKAPIAGVRQFVPSRDEENPFAAFSRPLKPIEPEPEPEPIPEPKAEEQPVPEPEPEPEPELEPKAEEQPEPEPLPEPIPEPEPEPLPEPIPEPEPEPEPMPQPIADPEALEENNAEDNAEDNDDDDDDDDEDYYDTNEGNQTKEKKKCRWWIWLLALLVLLCGCGLAYFMLPESSPLKQKANEILERVIPPSGSKHSKTIDIESMLSNTEMDQTSTADYSNNGGNGIFKMAGPFTFSSNTIEYESGEVSAACEDVSDAMADYVTSFLKKERYSKAYTYMMREIDGYTRTRMNELLDGTGYAPDRFVIYDDYIHQRCLSTLKSAKSRRSVATVIGELLNDDDAMLRSLLDNVLMNQDIEQDGKVVVNTEPKKPAGPRVPVYNFSKHGFDIIAGFYINYQTAEDLAFKMRNQGCDAYIIDINKLYYVSLGSTQTRTAAEKLYAHLSEWYTGDMAIKRW